MARERYPGERRGLSLFLEDLLSAAMRECGQDSILYHAIRRALTSGDLDHLRHARTIFNHLSREQRRTLSAAIVARSRSVNPPRSQDLLEAYGRRAPAPFAPRESRGEAAGRGTAAHGLPPACPAPAPVPAPVPAMLAAPTLPRTAADGLRRIAELIERDRQRAAERPRQAHGEPSARPGGKREGH